MRASRQRILKKSELSSIAVFGERNGWKHNIIIADMDYMQVDPSTKSHAILNTKLRKGTKVVVLTTTNINSTIPRTLTVNISNSTEDPETTHSCIFYFEGAMKSYQIGSHADSLFAVYYERGWPWKVILGVLGGLAALVAAFVYYMYWDEIEGNGFEDDAEAKKSVRK